MSKIKIIGIEKHNHVPELTRVLYSNGTSIALNKLIQSNLDLNSIIRMLYYESNNIQVVIAFIRQSQRRCTNTGKWVTINRFDDKYKTNTLIAQGYYSNVSVIKEIIDGDFSKNGLLSSKYHITSENKVKQQWR